ncbi:MAG: hypothetical protein JNJ83_12635 [Verrucomicrobiaceae bacterium]|nr:hypothetical protein [Verrucomicrobiaceae bacterium]
MRRIRLTDLKKGEESQVIGDGRLGRAGEAQGMVVGGIFVGNVRATDGNSVGQGLVGSVVMMTGDRGAIVARHLMLVSVLLCPPV